ncbi:MAG: glycerol-3-phosphate dehydrogenase/oxidase [Desulfobacteraceae bacterium]|nr:glycerol-3-phosphate dehydrogenase/oxidase [Desulfobacteraceae bacterium]MBC2755639.1 glycerol-3-phosphate dehydrogenase/oxidase [Desulfobacteraceae bacterium]
MKRFIEEYKDKTFDLIVIGGGITGAAVAYDAASRGFSVALVEKKDYGWATSAATSKLIHGGLRYLQNVELGLVRESLRERLILENIASNLVYPIQFLVPGYRDLKRNKWILRAGLTLYDILSYDRNRTWDKNKYIPHHSWLSRSKIMELEPEVRSNQMTGGSIYYDCQSIFPERLTLAFIKSAVRHGAETSNYAKVVDFSFSNNRKVKGVRVEDTLTGNTVDVRGALVINCAGPWADIVLNLADKSGNSKHQIKRSEGIHILTKKFKTRHALVMWTPSGRHFFTIPWRGYQLIGTTDKDYEGNPDEYNVSRQSVEELIKDTNDSIGDGNLKYEDVVYAWGGLRPLVDDQTEGTYESSRKYEIYDNASDGFDGLITVEGGKYTTSRHLAESVMKMVEKKFNRVPKKAITDKALLTGCEIKDMETFMLDLKKECHDFDPMTVDFLGRNYGSESRFVFELARQNPEFSEIICEDGQIMASVVYAIRNESAKNLKDILMRRTGVGNIGHPGKNILKKIAVVAAKELNWDKSKIEEELNIADASLRLPQA